MNNVPSQDPMMREIVKQAKRQQMTRRSLLGGGMAASMAALLAACSSGRTALEWDNWPYYMDGESDGSFPTLKAFEKKTGLKVNYPINVDDNNTYFARIKNQLATHTDTGADLICLTQWMVDRLIKNDYLYKLDYSKLPNVKAHMDPAYRSQFGDFDPGRKYSLPWKGVIAAIGYHKENYKKVTGKDAPTSLNDLWAPELKGKVEVLSEMRDTIGVMMMADGIDIKSFTADDFHNTLDKFTSLVSKGQIRGIKGNSYIDDYKSGDAVAGIVWAGDLIGANIELGSDVLGYVLLDSGSTISTDNFIIPRGAVFKDDAEKIIDYYFQPEVAAALALGGVYYVPPVLGAREIVIKKNPTLANNPLVFPTADDFATKLHQFRTLTSAEDKEFSKAWSDASNGVV